MRSIIPGTDEYDTWLLFMRGELNGVLDDWEGCQPRIWASELAEVLVSCLSYCSKLELTSE